MITIMAAIADNNALGKDNQLIWYLPGDLKRFKRMTLNHAVIMGRKTFESLGKPLPNRINIIITRDKNYKAEGCVIVNSLKEALKAAKEEDENPFILGGAEIYKQAMPFADKLDLTFVHHKFDADVFFPEIDKTIWKERSREDFKADEKNKYDYSFVTFQRL
ncbi:dihydrofolate reductase [Lutibacter sp.]|uniref:dihydrofolate reductase n=1 Tax=Lutibacter sp. TaxID=1925666 RepID=UPI003565E5D1